MIFEGAFSSLGKQTERTLQTLRTQLSVGVDPAYDYSKRISSPAKTKKPRREMEAVSPSKKHDEGWILYCGEKGEIPSKDLAPRFCEGN